MMRKASSSLMFQISIIIVIINTIVLTGFGIINYQDDLKTKRTHLEMTLFHTANRLALSVSLPLYNLDQKTIDEIINSEMQDEEVVAIHYYDSWTKKYFGYVRDQASLIVSSTIPDLPNTITYRQPIQFNGQELGYVNVIVTLSRMQEAINNSLEADIIQMIVMDIGLVILIILTFRIKIIHPIKLLTSSTSEIAQGNLDRQITVSNKDEIGTLASSFSSMRDSIKKQIIDLQTENTIRHQAENALRISEEKYRNVIENSMEVICVLQNGFLEYFNPETVNLLRYTEAELRGSTFETYIIPQDKKVFIDHCSKTELGETADQRQTYRIVKKDEEVAWIENKAVTIKWEQKPAVLMFISDITERKRTEELIIQTEKMMSIGGLAAGMAHEINNPLSAILQGTQNILRRLSPSFKKNKSFADAIGLDLQLLNSYLESRDIINYLKGIQISGKRASDIISNMLKFSRKSESKIVATNLTELVNNTIELAWNDYDLKKKYDFRKIEIIRNYEDYDQRLIAPCTQTEIEQVVLNLLKNSAHALSEFDQPNPRIIISIEKEPKYIRLEIEDNGPGIDDSIKNRIFEPFYTTKPVGEGTGLGLSVSYMIITNNHQGTLEVETEKGNGTRFIIRLPIVQKEANQEQISI